LIDADGSEKTHPAIGIEDLDPAVVGAADPGIVRRLGRTGADDPLNRSRANAGATQKIHRELGEADTVGPARCEYEGGILGPRAIGVVADPGGERDEKAGHRFSLAGATLDRGRGEGIPVRRFREGRLGGFPVGKTAALASGESLTRTVRETDPAAAGRTSSE
jgi:hypothetical protein